MTDRPLDPNDAPEGYVAVDDPGIACPGCDCHVPDNPTDCMYIGVTPKPCQSFNRADGHSVIFKRRPAPDSDAALLAEAVEMMRAFLSRYDAR